MYIIDPANLCGALDDGVEHRLHIRRRTANYAEHFGRSRLMLQSLSQFGVAFLDLFEQSDVFDSDHGLISERFKEFDLLVGEWAHLVPADGNCPNRSTFPHK